MLPELKLHPQIRKALENSGFNQATDVQKQVVPIALEGHDMQVSAQTGSGKTIAYLLPLIQKLTTPADSRCGSRSLILLPTRELAQQTLKEAHRFSEATNLKSVLVTGGQEGRYQASLLRRDPDIIVATPGRLLEHIKRGNAVLEDTETLIIDEADRMLDMGFRDEVMEIIQACKQERQTMLLSATLNHRGVRTIATEILKNPRVCDLGSAQTHHPSILQKMVLSDHPDHKRKQLVKLLSSEKYDKAIIFANKRTTVSELESFLASKGFETNQLHGEISQDERKHIMSHFRQGNCRILVATDLAARGLDIKGVDLIINFDMAHSGDEYVHRIGRTGRADGVGTAISLVADYEWNLVAGIQRYLRQEFEKTTIPGLEAKYKGPKKLKSSGKAATKKKRQKSETKNSKKRQANSNKKTGVHNKKTARKAGEISNEQRSGMLPPRKQK